MNKLISGIAAAFHFFPFVVAGVSAVEQAMPSAPGDTKKAAVLSVVSAMAKIGEAIPEAHVQIISTLVDSLVGALNATGWFTHKTPTPATK